MNKNWFFCHCLKSKNFDVYYEITKSCAQEVDWHSSYRFMKLSKLYLIIFVAPKWEGTISLDSTYLSNKYW